MGAPDLHKLVNAPFGAAKRAMVKAGCWHELDDETGLPLWLVEIDVTRTEREAHTVPAATEAEAKKAALKLARDEHGSSAAVDIWFVSPASLK